MHWIMNWIMSWITYWSLKTRSHPILPRLPDEMWHKIILMLRIGFQRDTDFHKRRNQMLQDQVRMLRKELRHRLKLQKSMNEFQKSTQFFKPPSRLDAALPFLMIILAPLAIMLIIATAVVSMGNKAQR